MNRVSTESSAILSSARELLDEAVQAHGGLERWRNIAERRVRASSGGFAFARKLQYGALENREVRVATRIQRTMLIPYPSLGRLGVFEAGTVRIESEDGEILQQRDDPRSAFGKFRQGLWWDALDLLYFAGRAIA